MFGLEIRLVEPVGEEVSGFDLGHMRLQGERGACDSRDLGSRGAMMVFITLVDMVDGVCAILSGEKSGHKLIGTDSAWVVHFCRSKRGIVIRCGAAIIDDLDGPSIRRALLEGIYQFAGAGLSLLPTKDPVRGDLVSAIGRLSALS